MTNKPSDESLPTQNIPADSQIFNIDASGVTPEHKNTGQLIIVSFYLPERSDPIIIHGSRTITIGRRDPKRRINPSLDLTEDHGAKLGVSRMHAEMNFVNGKYYLKDTGSSNGTWVNDTKLQAYQPHPVITGDQIRIGQIAIVVHLTLPQRNNSLDAISTVIDEASTIKIHAYQVSDNIGGILVENNAIVVSKLRTLSTYLEQLGRIHNIIREAQQQEATSFSVVGIRARSIDSALIIDVSEGSDLMDFMAEKLDNFVAVMKGKSKGNKKQTDSLNRYPDPIAQIADYTLQELVFRFLNESRDEYVDKLASHFDTLLTIDLTLKKTSN